MEQKINYGAKKKKQYLNNNVCNYRNGRCLMKNIAIIGSGSWGVALALLLKSNGHNIKIWSYSKEEADIINNEHKCKFLPGINLPTDIVCYTELERTIDNTDIVLIVTPSKAIRSTLTNLKPFVSNQIFVLCSKGLEANTQMTFSMVVNEILPNNKVATLSGPSHAEEVAISTPTAVVIASKDEEILPELQDVFMNNTFRVYTNSDIIGVELGGSLKNIIALSCGIAVGLGYGDNTIAALVTRGLLEISRLGIEVGANPQTFYGLSGLGDLFVTCSSVHSRNRAAGIFIGQGKSIEDAVKEVGMVVEGVNAVDGAYVLSKKYDVSTPVIDEIYEIVHNGKDPKEATISLMNRGKRTEF
jgi:glycerol-3-phosphate dehydrogenase (NAD(P)+)